MASASLTLSGVTKRYPGVLALDHVNFECRPGEIHAVLGENGSGKSTLLGIASGATEPDEGRVIIMGKVLSAADPLLARRLGLAIVYQDDSLIRELSVAENLVLGAGDGMAGMRGKDAWAARVLAPYQLDIAPDMQVGLLTPAQRQFLEIVKALIANPSVLLLDEPTASLDVSGVGPAERYHSPHHSRGHGGGIRQPPTAGNPRPRQPRHHPSRWRRPGHLRCERQAVGSRPDRADGWPADRSGVPAAPARGGDATGAGGRKTSNGRALPRPVASSCVAAKSSASPERKATASATRSAPSAAWSRAAA